MNNFYTDEELLTIDETPVEHETADLDEVVSIIKSAENTLILTHVNPDGDCVGSAYALLAIIEAMGKRAMVACPSAFPKRLRFLTHPTWEDESDPDSPVPSLFTPEEDNPDSLGQFDRIISVDVASPMQLGDNGFLIPKIDLMIDHHGTGEPFAKNYVDPTASASGEIVYEIYRRLRDDGLSPVSEAARRMYAAIVSDTGSFKFSNTTKKTHLVAAELVEEINAADDGGADSAEVCRSLFGQRTLKELTAQMIAIQNLRFYEDGRLGAVMFTQDILTGAGLDESEIGNVVDTPRGVEGVLVGISLKQSSADPTQFKVSSRANAEIDCAAVCASFGGGGHIRAAGCTITADSPEEALEIMSEAFGKAIREYKK